MTSFFSFSFFFKLIFFVVVLCLFSVGYLFVAIASTLVVNLVSRFFSGVLASFLLASFLLFLLLILTQFSLGALVVDVMVVVVVEVGRLLLSSIRS